MKNRILTLLTLSFLLFLDTDDGYAARYVVQPINAQEVNSINNLGTIVGISDTGEPFVWKKDEETNEYFETNKIILPTPNPYSDMHVLDISNEFGRGTGGNIVGWFVDETNTPQSILWYLEENDREEFDYNFVLLPPHSLKASHCSTDNETDFFNPECMNERDSELIYRATFCAANNADWRSTNVVYVDKNFDFIAGNAPDCSNAIPICEFKTKRKKTGETTIKINDEEIIKDIFEYTNNEIYEGQGCITQDHAILMEQATECDNSSFQTAGDPITIQCDISSTVTSINNGDIVVGTSIKRNFSQRPIFWIKTEKRTEDNKPIYLTGDLGTNRIKPENQITEFQELEIDTDTGEEIFVTYFKNEIYETTYRDGSVSAIDKQSPSVIGQLKISSTDTQFTPVQWTGISSSGFEKPLELKQLKSTKLVTRACSGEDGEALDLSTYDIHLTSIANGIIIGWYENTEGDQVSVSWVTCPSKDDEEVTNTLTPGLFAPLDINGTFGKVLSNNVSLDTVGSFITSTNITPTGEPHAFLRTTLCGVEDLNTLLVTEDANIRLESANMVATGGSPASIIATGLNISEDQRHYYVMTPKTVFLDLQMSMSTEKRELTVGEANSFSVTLTNNGTIENPNFATCTFFSISATVIQEGIAEDDELAAGLTFERIESVSNIPCEITQIQVVCAIDRLNPNDTINLKIFTTPRKLLADRSIRVTSRILKKNPEYEKDSDESNNTSNAVIKINREACFIATAAYGSYFHPEVKVLRNFRDNVLLKSDFGTRIVGLYYRYSPPFADYIRNKDILKGIIRIILKPIVFLILQPIIALLILACICFVIMNNLHPLYRRVNSEPRI